MLPTEPAAEGEVFAALAIPSCGERRRQFTDLQIDLLHDVPNWSFVTELIDKDTNKTAIQHVFALPEFPPGMSSPPASEWKVISKDDVVYFSGIKRSDGKVMFKPIGSIQFASKP